MASPAWPPPDGLPLPIGTMQLRLVCDAPLFARRATAAKTSPKEDARQAAGRYANTNTFGNVNEALAPSPKFRGIRLLLIQFVANDFRNIGEALFVFARERLNLLGRHEL